MKGWRLTSTAGGDTSHTPPTCARSDCAKAFSCCRLAPRLSPRDRQPSDAAYGSSGRPREVGAILRCVLTSDGIAARPPTLVRCEHAPGPRHGTAAASGRYTPTDPSPQISPPRHVRVPREAPSGPRVRLVLRRTEAERIRCRRPLAPPARHASCLSFWPGTVRPCDV